MSAKNNLITSYFNKQIGQIQPITNTTNSKKQITQFFDKCVSEELHGCSKQVCRLEKLRLEAIISESKERIKNIESSVAACTEVCEKKDKLIREIQQTNDISGDATKNKVKLLAFSDFSENFPQNQLAILRSIDSTSAQDSFFVLCCVRNLYNENLHVLNQRSVTGRHTGAVKKIPMTPKKRIVVEKMFNERIDILCLDFGEHQKRLKKLNTHLKNAILKAAKSEEETNFIA